MWPARIPHAAPACMHVLLDSVLAWRYGWHKLLDRVEKRVHVVRSVVVSVDLIPHVPTCLSSHTSQPVSDPGSAYTISGTIRHPHPPSPLFVPFCTSLRLPPSMAHLRAAELCTAIASGTGRAATLPPPATSRSACPLRSPHPRAVPRRAQLSESLAAPAASPNGARGAGAAAVFVASPAAAYGSAAGSGNQARERERPSGADEFVNP